MDTWHPIIVHFPLVLLPLSALFDLVGFLGGKRAWHQLAYGFLAASLVASLAALISGNSAAAPYWTIAEIGPVLERHEDLASATLVVVLVSALGRLPLYLQQRWDGWPLKLWFAVMLGGLVLLWLTGYWGGELVYRYGVGVKAITPPVLVQ